MTFSKELHDLYYQKSDAAHTYFSGKITREEFESLMEEVRFLASVSEILADDLNGYFDDVCLTDLLRYRASVPKSDQPPT